MVPPIKAIPSPPNTGSVAKRALAKIVATAVNNIGLALVCTDTEIAFSILKCLSSISCLAKSMIKSEFLELIPIKAIKPIREVPVI